MTVVLLLFGSIVALKSNLFVAATHIKCLFVLHRIFFTIYGHYSVTTYVDYAQFAAFEEVSDFRAQFAECFQLQDLVYRHGTSVDEAVIKCISDIDFIRRHNFLHHE